MKVVITRSASTEIAEIGRYIKHDSPGRAMTFVRELSACCGQLGLTPNAYPLLPTREDRGIRRRVDGRYLIFYRVAADTVEVLNVVHGARDCEMIPFPDD